MYKNIKFSINREIQYYLIGFILSIALTIIPFFSVMQKIFSDSIIYVLILFCAVIQIIVHFIYFLNLNNFSAKKIHFISLLFSIIIILIIMFGSLWIMHSLKHVDHLSLYKM